MNEINSNRVTLREFPVCIDCGKLFNWFSGADLVGLDGPRLLLKVQHIEAFFNSSACRHSKFILGKVALKFKKVGCKHDGTSLSI